MSGYQGDLENEFFIIDSSNLDTIEQRLYGFSLTDNEVIDNQSMKDNISLDAEGAYVYVEVNKDEIKISQDFNGSYGLYLFKSDDYFAISNSFLKLVDYLKYSHELTLNKEYAEAFLYTHLVSFAYKDTLVNEIELIARDYIIKINKNNKTLDFSEIDYEENTIHIDSKEGIEILDAWYYKWVNNIRNLKNKTNNITIDLTGGFDSRIIACLWLTANIDLNKIRINSNPKHKEDYEIASQMAECYNFKLNQNVSDNKSYKFKEIETSLKHSFYVRLGFHKKPYFKTKINSKIVYTLNGFGGEALRGFPYQTPKEYLEWLKKRFNKKNPELFEPTKGIVLKTWDELSKKFNIDKNSKELTERHYREVRNRLHFGSGVVTNFLENRYALSPLNDPLLRKLNLKLDNINDSYILFGIIFLRYCPELLEFKFDENRKINQETLDYASKLNIKYPFVKKELNYISGPEIKIIKTNNKTKAISSENVENILTDVFLSNSFEMEFKKYFSKYDYNTISNNFLNPKLKHTHSVAFSEIFASISIVKIGSDCEFSQINNKKNLSNWFMQFNPNNKSDIDGCDLNILNLIKYNNAIIHIKCSNKNSLEFIGENNIVNNIYSPKRLQKKNVKVYVINSYDNHIDLKIKSNINDKIVINLKGSEVLDKLNNMFPVYIDYTNFEINGEKIISENTLVSFEDSFTYSKKVKEGDIINFKISWLPFNKDSVYKNNMIINKIKRLLKR